MLNEIVSPKGIVMKRGLKDTNRFIVAEIWGSKLFLVLTEGVAFLMVLNALIARKRKSNTTVENGLVNTTYRSLMVIVGPTRDLSALTANQ